MSDVRFSAIWAVSGIAIAVLGIVLALVDAGTSVLTVVDAFAWPGFTMLELISDGRPNLFQAGIAFVGQYLGYFVVIFTIRKIYKIIYVDRALH